MISFNKYVELAYLASKGTNYEPFLILLQMHRE